MNAAAPIRTADTDLDSWLSQQTGKGLLRFLTCGSVDDGKSTLIGRLLYDSQLILDDQLASLRKESRNRTTGDEGIDFSLLVDGLAAEREQGITIDVAYRFFSTDKRKFIVADTPGHEQYTRNMATGASNADLAIVLIDARKGVLTQTRRHSFILSLIGVKHVVLAINKIDLVGYDADVFKTIETEYREFARSLGFETLVAIPVSALKGDNILMPSAQMPWYRGPQLVPYLETIEVASDRTAQPMRFPVQWVNRPNLDFRGFSGTVASGIVKVGDDVLVARFAQAARITRIVTMDGDQQRAIAGEAVTLVLDREVDISRGDVLSHPGETPEFSNQFQARMVWMSDESAFPGRSYLLKLGAQDRAGDDHRSQIPHQRQHARAERRQDAGAQRSRHADHRHRQADRLRFLCEQRTNRRLHPDRPHLERHSGRGRHRLRPSPRAESELAVVRRESHRPRRNEGPEARDRLVHRPVGLGASPPSPICSKKSSRPKAGTPTFSMATMSATASTRISASPTRRASRTSGGSAKWRG